MKKWFLLAVVLSSACMAQTVTPLQLNAVTISFSTAVIQTNEAQKNLDDLRKKFAPRESRIQALNTEVESMKKDLNTAGNKLSETERASRAQALETREKQLQRDSEDFQNDSQSESQEVFRSVAARVYSFLQEYAQQHGYTFVIERGSEDNPIVWYAANNTDITAAVVQAYNTRSGIAAPAKPAAASPAPKN